MRASLFALALLALAACDSAEPVTPAPLPADPQPAAPLLSFDLSETATTEYTLTVGEVIRTTTIFLFVGEVLPPNVVFTARSSNPSVVRETLRSTELTLTGVGGGEAFIEIGMAAAGYRDTTVMLSVTVPQSRCPGDAPEGTADFFPVDESTVWQFSYTSSDTDASGTDTRVQGTMEMRFGAARCLNGSRMRPVSYLIAGQRSRNGRPDGQVTIQKQAELFENEANSLSIAFPFPEGMVQQSESFDRYIEGPSQTLRARGSVTCVGTGRLQDDALLLRRGVGLVENRASCDTTNNRFLGFTIVRTL